MVYYNPATGDHRTPARSDVPMPEVYAAQGYERMEIMSMTTYEKQTGVVHEASNYSGEAPLLLEPPVPSAPKEAIQDVVDDMRAAIASGPWTGGI